MARSKTARHPQEVEDPPVSAEHVAKCKILDGVDAEGARHYFTGKLVYVLEPEEDEFQYVFDVAAAGWALPEWIEHVEQKRGWEYHNYVGDLTPGEAMGKMIADALRVVEEGPDDADEAAVSDDD